MKLLIWGLAVCTAISLAAGALAISPAPHEIVFETEQDAVGDDAATAPLAGKVLQDTIWIADWSFDTPSGCSEEGWVKWDNRITNDGSNYWCVSNAYADSGLIVNNAAVLKKHDVCWAHDGYGNDWDYAIQVKYQGGAGNGTLALHYLSDSEPGYDFVSVETDSACASQARVNLVTAPTKMPEDYRDQVFRVSGLNKTGNATGLLLKDYGPGTHCALIRFVSYGSYSDEDGLYPTYWKSPLIVDGISVDMPPAGAGGADYVETFEAASGCGGSATGLDPRVSFINAANSTPFGEWARVYQHVTDNDKCTENTTCAWLNSDPSLPAYFPDMAFGPGGAVVRNWLDDCKASPWVSLASTPNANATVLQWRRCGATRVAQGMIAQNWSLRSKVRASNTDTSTLGDSVDCVAPWQHTTNWSTFNSFNWFTGTATMTANVVPRATEIQLRFRLIDWQFLTGNGPPATLNPGPGPYDDRIKIGRRFLSGPVLNEGIDSRTQSQDAFGAVDNAIHPGEHHSPATGPNRRFEAVPFDEGTELAFPCSRFFPNLVTGDSIQINVTDARGAGGYQRPKLYGAIVSGPHQGKRPPGASAGPDGFFVITADSCRGGSGVPVANNYFVDLPDHYLRGGDEVVYFWGAKDNLNGFSSDPGGISGDGGGNPLVSSVDDAVAKTGGLLGMSALPTIDWDPSYVAAVQASPDGNVAPTPEQIAGSRQRHCILYYNHFTTRRRSGDLQRTSFMYTLDQLGYRGHYDVYDVQGFGNTNNALGSRATELHCTGYALLIQDAGRSSSSTVEQGQGPPCIEGEKINQAQWYRNWLANGVTSEIGTATLWILGENVVQEKGTLSLFTQDMGVTLGNADNGSGSLNPDVVGQAAMTFWNGCTANFAGDKFSLNGGCPTFRTYDGLSPTSGTVTHKYQAWTTTSPYGAVVMNKNAGNHWNTVMSAFGWFDIRDALGDPPGTGARDLMGKILSCAVPDSCQQQPNPTGVPDETSRVPAHTALFQNVPNPFNPATEIRFDLSRSGHVELRIFDVAGRVVRTLVNGPLVAGQNLRVLWNGHDGAGHRVSSGIYFYRLVAADFTATRKMVLLD